MIIYSDDILFSYSGWKDELEVSVCLDSCLTELLNVYDSYYGGKTKHIKLLKALL